MNDTAESAAERLTRIAAELVAELYPASTRAAQVTLQSDLDRDLGLDSLARVELLLRMERAFAVRLPERVLGQARTLQDLLHALSGTAQPPPSPTPVARIEPLAAGEVALPPDSLGTLTQALLWHAERNAERVHIHIHTEDDNFVPLRYGELHRKAERLAAALRARGVRDGQTVTLMLPTGEDFFIAFAGVLLAGAVPVPIYPPARLNQIEDHLLRQRGILRNAETVAMITVPEAKAIARLLQGQVAALRLVTTVSELMQSAAEPLLAPTARAEDLALLQYTSGSTGKPKGVMLTHANLLANLRAMREPLAVTPDDVFVSWLPLYHDMGLIGAWLGALYCAYPLVIMSPLAFLARPARWLRTLHRFRGTMSAAPNFAYELCLNKIDDAELEGLDLSAWRFTLNGAEPVSPATMQRFGERFQRYGFRPEAMMPVYGLAEASLAVAFPPLGRGPKVDTVQRETFVRDGRAVPAAAGASEVLQFVCCGRALAGHAMRIVDEQGAELPERRQGHLLFKGPSTTQGYYRNPQETERMRRGEWLDSFDLAYLADGEVYITGRAKDVIIRAGRNLYPYELEIAVGALAGIRKGCVAAFGSRDERAGTERLVVVAETRERDPAARERLMVEINALATELVGTPADEIVLAAPHSVLKTSSGKIRRAATRERYEAGSLSTRPVAVWRQFLHLGVGGLLGSVTRAVTNAGRLAFGAYAMLAFTVVAAIAWIGVMVLPSRAARPFARAMARTALRSIRMLPRLLEAQHLPALASYVAVANHSSYLDGVVLFAALPGTPSFVVKGELERHPAVGRFLQKIGMQFAERFDTARSLEHASQFAARVKAGQAMVFFPEGTLRRTPGLLPFRTGAFLIAAQTGAPVVPIAIRGTRHVLPDGTWLPRRGPITIEICAPVAPQGSDFAAALKLRDASRGAIAAVIDEPSLAEPVETVLTRPRAQA